MSETRKGELYITAETLLWAFFPVITTLSYSGVSALSSLAWSSLFAGVLFGAMVAYRNKWRELAQPLFWKYIVGVTVFIGIFFYALYFIGLEYTTPGNAAIVMLFQVAASYIFFQLFRREAFSGAHTIGAIFLCVGAFVVLGKSFNGINIGDFLVLAGACVAPVGNYFQQKAREVASSETIMFVRSIAAAAVIFCLAALFGAHTSLGSVWANIPFLLINGFLLLGLSKIFFLEAIHRIPVTKAIALESMSPILTLFIAWMLLGQRPDFWQLTSLIPMILGVLLITDQLSLTLFRKHSTR